MKVIRSQNVVQKNHLYQVTLRIESCKENDPSSHPM
jgi:hypothetical protein